MKHLVIDQTKSTPSIHFNNENNILSITGNSYPENTAKFYAPVFSWLEDFLLTTGGEAVTAELEINYFNSSSSKVFMDFFDRLENVAAQGCSVTINWRYHEENDMAAEYGEEFQEELCKVDFNLIAFSD